MGPYNPLHNQLKYDKNTGKVAEWIFLLITEWMNVGKNKGDCDREMVKSLDDIPYGEMPRWGQTARFPIDTKQKLGLGVQGNGKSRRVKN